MKLSIIIPGIRVEQWRRVYDSICASTSRSFELILITPYDLPANMKKLSNVKWVRDFGSPVRCSDIGLSHCEGELITWNADDGEFLPGMLDKAIDAFEAMPAHPKNVLVLKYMEGARIVQPDDYYMLTKAYPKVTAAQDDWWIFNLAITKRDYFRSLGGWDSIYFETLAFSHADMAIRAYQDGCITELFPAAIVYNSHGHADHKPVEQAHWENDHPLYCKIHNDPAMLNRKVDINNWNAAETFWKRRFGL